MEPSDELAYYYTVLLHEMLSKTDSKAGKELVEKYAHEGTFRCPNPVLQGQLREENGQLCDVFLATGLPFDCWPKHVIQPAARARGGPVELLYPSGSSGPVEWTSRSKPQVAAMPRALCSSPATSPTDLPGPSKFMRRFLEEHSSVTYVVKRTEPPFNIESVFKIKWTQLVLDGYQQLVEENDRVRRGDPNSMAISYFRYESFAGDSGTPYYRAIVCPAIVQGPSGFWEPWQQGLHVYCPLFTSPNFRWISSTEETKFREQMSSSASHARDAHSSFEARTAHLMLPPPIGQQFPPMQQNPLDLSTSPGPFAHRHLFKDPGFPRQHELSHRQRRIYQQDVTRYV